MRLFVAVWPPGPVVDQLRSIERPEVPGLRWTTEPQWHVTLVFLGEVPQEQLGDLHRRMADAVSRLPPGTARMGPRAVLVGRSVLALPVSGLDEMAATVRTALASSVPGMDDKPFRGHLTLGRARGGRRIPATLVAVSLSATWAVSEVCLVASTTAPSGARYETLARASLARSR
jgi:2'-5' RNA ligase